MWRILADALLEWLPVGTGLTQRAQAIAGLLIDPRALFTPAALLPEVAALITSLIIVLAEVKLGVRPDPAFGGVAALAIGIMAWLGALMMRLELLAPEELRSMEFTDGVLAGIVQGLSLLGFGGSGMSVAVLTATGLRFKEAVILSSLASVPVIAAWGVDLAGLASLAIAAVVLYAASRRLNSARPTTISLICSTAIAAGNRGSVMALFERRLYYSELTGRIASWVEKWGATGLIMAMIVQSIISPIPADAVLVAAGALGMSPTMVGIVGGLGSALGAMANFYIARLAGRPFVERIFKKSVLDTVDRWFKRWGALAIIVARLTPFSPIDLVSYAAGLTEMKPLHFLLANLIALVPRAALFGYIGKLLSMGRLWPIALVLAAVVLSAILFALRGKIRSTKRVPDEGK